MDSLRVKRRNASFSYLYQFTSPELMQHPVHNPPKCIQVMMLIIEQNSRILRFQYLFFRVTILLISQKNLNHIGTQPNNDGWPAKTCQNIQHCWATFSRLQAVVRNTQTKKKQAARKDLHPGGMEQWKPFEYIVLVFPGFRSLVCEWN